MALSKEEIEAAFEEHLKETGCNVCKQAKLQNLALHACAYCGWSAEAVNLDSDAPRPYLVLHDFFPDLSEVGWTIHEHKVAEDGEAQMIVMIPPMGISKITQCFFGSVKDKGLYLVATTYDNNFVGEWFTDMAHFKQSEEKEDASGLLGGFVDVDMSGGGVMVPGSVLDGATDTDDIMKRLQKAAGQPTQDDIDDLGKALNDPNATPEEQAVGGSAQAQAPAPEETNPLTKVLNSVIKRAQDGEDDMPQDIEDALLVHTSEE